MTTDRFKDAFDKIQAEDSLKNSTREFLSTQTRSYKQPRLHSSFHSLAAAACLLFVLLGIGGYAFFIPVSAISVDINPSIELSLNRFDKVLSVKGYNEDGRRLADELDIRFSEYTDALEAILDNKTVAGCLSRGEIVSITVLGDNEQKSAQILSQIESRHVADNQNVHCHSGSAKETHAAHASGLSFGKYQAFLELQKFYPEITTEDVQHMTMREIQDMIDSCSDDADTSSGHKPSHDSSRHDFNKEKHQNRGSSNHHSDMHGNKKGTGHD